MVAHLKVLTVVGARPQFVKAAVVSRALNATPGVEEILVHTGQHYDDNMSGLFFRQLGISAPRYSLDVGSGLHGWQTGRMLESIEKTLLAEQPAIVLVYGDTNSTLAGALAAVKLHIPVAHVEAGLRSFNRTMPEEINRVLTDHAATLLLAPTDTAVRHLRSEGISDTQIINVGDVMFDAALWFAAQARDVHMTGIPKEFVLVTIHRAENTDDEGRMRVIVDALIAIANEISVVWPVHPRTRARLAKLGMLERLQRSVHLTEPVGYLEMIALEKSSKAIVTDSGGVQKEAFFFRVPCCTLRTETEWTELVDLRWNRLIPPSSVEAIRAGVGAVIGTRGREAAPFGDGHAGERIRDLIVSRRWAGRGPSAS